MTATDTTARPVLLGDRLHCPKCATELDIWEETRQLDRIGYTAPRWDNDAKEWTYTSDDNPRNESVELLDRYAQCRARACGYLAPVEDRYDHDLPDMGDHWTCPGSPAATQTNAPTSTPQDNPPSKPATTGSSPLTAAGGGSTGTEPARAPKNQPPSRPSRSDHNTTKPPQLVTASAHNRHT